MCFEYHREYISERAVASRRVVECLDVIEDGKLSVTATVRNRLIQSGVGLQSAPERFHRRVVVAITSAAHAPFNASGVERINVVAVDILAAAIRVMEESCGGLPTLQGIGEGGQDETGMQGMSTVSAAAIKIAFFRRFESYVCVAGFSSEASLKKVLLRRVDFIPL